MLRKDERRSLDDIERRLIADDPEWAKGLSEAGLGGSHRWRMRRVSPRTATASATIVLAVVFLTLGEVPPALLAGFLAAVLLVSRSWSLHT